MSTKNWYTPVLGSVLVVLFALVATACEQDTDCPMISYACPEGEEPCEDNEEDGCKEYTIGDGECATTRYCIIIDDDTDQP